MRASLLLVVLLVVACTAAVQAASSWDVWDIADKADNFGMKSATIKSALNKTAAVLNKTAAVPGLAAKAAWLNRTAESKLAAVNATLATVAGKV